MLTKKTEYAIKALVQLAKLPLGDFALGPDIAKAQDIPQKFLEGILGQLRSSGFVSSRKGPGGGYALSMPGSKLMLGEIVRHFEGPVALLACASVRKFKACDNCSDPTACVIRSIFVDVRNRTAEILDTTSLQDILEREKDK